MTFNTYDFVKELTTAGMPEPQAEMELRPKHDLTMPMGSMLVVTIGVIVTLTTLL